MKRRRWAAAVALVVALIGRMTAPAEAEASESKVRAPDGAVGDQFGRSVDIDDEWLVIGSIGDDDGGSMSGSAYVFRRDGLDWRFEAKLTASDARAGDEFGGSVAVSGERIVVGARLADSDRTNSGAVYVFERSGSAWRQQAKLIASDRADEDQFGFSVDIHRDSIVVGSPFDDDQGTLSGSAYVFGHDGAAWTEQAKLVPNDSQAEDKFGFATSLDGGLVLIGSVFAAGHTGQRTGAAYLYRVADGQRVARLTPSIGQEAGNFGTAVALDGGTALVGAILDGSSGAAYVYTGQGGVWSERALLQPDAHELDDFFGSAVGLRSGRAAVGAFTGTGQSILSGVAYVFEGAGASWDPDRAVGRLRR